MTGDAKTKFSETFGGYLDRRSMTQSSVADATGTSRAYVSSVSTGKKPVGPTAVDNLADAIKATDEERTNLHRAAAIDAGFKLDLPDDF
jgi:transcriptional regulator with XRE-family HTH domain